MWEEECLLKPTINVLHSNQITLHFMSFDSNCVCQCCDEEDCEGCIYEEERCEECTDLDEREG